ncbi:MAG: hypothetical protein L6R38_001808 [Xanthoria sp. 2 TBL-2021]|nr:MAG: hypothetical protein L6R38_001808 [Xanthoria sp. 2 TBL-2021]
MSKHVVGEHLRHFTRSTSLVALPAFLLPSIFHRFNDRANLFQPSKQKRTSVRRLATASSRIRLLQDGVVEAVEKERNARALLNDILHAATTTNPKLWTCMLEAYLPRHLHRNDQEADAVFTDTNRPVSVRNLHRWLAEARRTKEPAGDLLTYLLVKENRQDAVVWLVEAMLKEHAKALHPSNSLSELLSLSRQTQPVPSLQDMTHSAEIVANYLDVQRSSGVSLTRLTDFAPRSAAHICLGEIWRSVGSMILQAADHEPTSAESRSIMTCVLRILAHLHHFEAVPSSIYNQAPAPDPSVLQRPPTLYFWSSRIMTDLSDASFHSVNPNPISGQSDALGLDHPNNTHGKHSLNVVTGQPMPEVEPQIWLDFVLWCCVDGGWITEAAEIVSEMWTRSTEGQQFSVIDWNTLRKQTAPKLPWTTRMKMAINGSRMREFAGGPSLGIYDERASSLKPPERTVSSEVIAAIVDGLVSTTSSRTKVHGNKPSVVELHISVCKKTLDRKRVGLGSNSWDSVILRMAESPSSESEAAQTSETFFEQIMSWSPPFLQEPASANSAYQSQSMAQAYVADPSAITVGLLHRLLLDFTLAGNYRAALRIFQRLQNTVDANRRISFDNFPIMVSPSPRQDQEEPLIDDKDQPQAPGLNPQLPAIVLAPFLKLATDFEDLEMGRWLLYSNDVDGCIIPPKMYSNPVLHPALISFASAAGDKRLLESVMRHVKTPVPEDTLRALLHHQIRCEEWYGVPEIFELFRDTEGSAWAASDVLVLAGAVLRLEKRDPRVSRRIATAISPGTLLHRVMSGRYNTPHDPSKPRDLSQTRLLNQLARIVASVPSRLSEDLSPFCNMRYNQLSASQDIPPRAFNYFLSTVTELFGLYEGKQLCEQWCSFPALTGPVKTPYMEYVVEPNAQTYYIFLRRISHARMTSDKKGGKPPTSSGKLAGKADGGPQISNRVNEDEQSIIDWAVAGCLDLGVPLKRVKLDFPVLKDSCKDRRSASVDFNRDSGDDVDSEIA